MHPNLVLQERLRGYNQLSKHKIVHGWHLTHLISMWFSSWRPGPQSKSTLQTNHSFYCYLEFKLRTKVCSTQQLEVGAPFSLKLKLSTITLCHRSGPLTIHARQLPEKIELRVWGNEGSLRTTCKQTPENSIKTQPTHRKYQTPAVNLDVIELVSGRSSSIIHHRQAWEKCRCYTSSSCIMSSLQCRVSRATMRHTEQTLAPNSRQREKEREKQTNKQTNSTLPSYIPILFRWTSTPHLFPRSRHDTFSLSQSYLWCVTQQNADNLSELPAPNCSTSWEKKGGWGYISLPDEAQRSSQALQCNSWAWPKLHNSQANI